MGVFTRGVTRNHDCCRHDSQ